MVLSEEMQVIRGRIERLARSSGIALVGYAPLDGIQLRGDVLKEGGGMAHAVSLVLEIDSSASYERQEVDRFYEAMLRGRGIMDDAANAIAVFLHAQGFKALPVTSSYVTDREAILGQISHKGVAHQAGLGWIGRSTLLVTPDFGPRVRLMTVITDAELDDGTIPMENRCGSCRACIEGCPMKALRFSEFIDHPKERSDSIDYLKCDRHERSTLARAVPEFCAMCITTCPVGRSVPTLE